MAKYNWKQAFTVTYMGNITEITMHQDATKREVVVAAVQRLKREGNAIIGSAMLDDLTNCHITRGKVEPTQNLQTKTIKKAVKPARTRHHSDNPCQLAFPT